MVSVVIPLYNKASHIAKTLKCVLAQTYTDYEIVVVNDGSTDNSAEVVRSCPDPRIRLIDQPNGGVSSARNRGTQEATGEYVAYLDADDEWEPDYLATQMSLVEKYPYCTVFVVNYRCSDINGRITYPIINNLPFTENDGELINYFIVASSSHPPICSITIMVRREAMLSIGGFPVGIRSGEDLLTWARLAARYRIAYCREAKATFNVEGYNVKERPKRIPADVDIVGRELKKLAGEFHPAGINGYISHWHKMRSSIYMRLSMRRRSIREALIGLRYAPLNYKLYAYIALNMLPSRLRPF